MKKESSEYYKTLADLSGDPKFEALQAFQAGQEKLREIQEANPLLMTYMRAMQPIVEAMKPIRDLLMPIIETQQAVTQYLTVLQHLSKDIHLLPAEGWYFSLEFIDALGIENLDDYLQRDPAAFEADVIKAFANQLVSIEKKLTIAFPKRAKLMTIIFALHNAENYEAAIPLALAQADGMCKDSFFLLDKDKQKIPVGFFDMVRNKSLRPQKLSQSFEVPETSIFNVLFNQLAKEDRNSSLVLEGNTTRLSDLNRHAILHGESTDYGTRTNSIKAILLLDFIEDLRIMDNVLTEKWKS